VVDANLNTTPPVGTEWIRGDANRDGVITGDDYTTIDSSLGRGVGNPLVPSAVPEPMVGLLGGVIATLTIRQRVRRGRVFVASSPL
jgi:hypothetical protein